MPLLPCLSIRQPYAWAIMAGIKPVENRTWATKYRGPLAIHASLKADAEPAWSFCEGQWESLVPNSICLIPRKSVDYGGIIGTVDLVDCVTESDSPWFFGPYGFVLANPRPCKFVPMKGQLGLFNINANLIERAE